MILGKIDSWLTAAKTFLTTTILGKETLLISLGFFGGFITGKFIL